MHPRNEISTSKIRLHSVTAKIAKVQSKCTSDAVRQLALVYSDSGFAVCVWDGVRLRRSAIHGFSRRPLMNSPWVMLPSPFLSCSRALYLRNALCAFFVVINKLNFYVKKNSSNNPSLQSSISTALSLYNHLYAIHIIIRGKWKLLEHRYKV